MKYYYNQSIDAISESDVPKNPTIHFGPLASSHSPNLFALLGFWPFLRQLTDWMEKVLQVTNLPNIIILDNMFD